jgi:hypothetical protein
MVFNRCINRVLRTLVPQTVTMEYTTTFYCLLAFTAGCIITFMAVRHTAALEQMSEADYRRCVHQIICQSVTPGAAADLIAELNNYMDNLQTDLRHLSVELEQIVRNVTNTWDK